MLYKYTQDQRLKKPDEFSSVFLFRKVRYGAYLKIHFKPNELSVSRLGLIISRKNHKKSNKRNYMKRLLRELFRQNSCLWNSYDIVVRAQKCFTDENYQEIYDEFKYLTKILMKI